MISTPGRQEAIALIEEACDAGARRALACRELGITVRTLQRWTQEGAAPDDGRTQCSRTPHNKLSAQERAAVLAVANESRFASLPPTQIVPALADEGRYLAGLNFVSPQSRHCGSATTILAKRHTVYTEAKARHPQRWGKRATRDWSLPEEVWLNKPASDETGMRKAA